MQTPRSDAQSWITSCDSVQQREHDDESGRATMGKRDETTDISLGGYSGSSDGKEDAGWFAPCGHGDEADIDGGALVQIGSARLNEGVARHVAHEDGLRFGGDVSGGGGAFGTLGAVGMTMLWEV